ncbi:MAG: hypothetical protein JJU46_04920 [Balneolaceae bacterium]|nr:hypothetical protein [Balneolaceae bacterium]MCH8549600.1 hypothetical protein [Balneolaceae bacterium]
MKLLIPILFTLTLLIHLPAELFAQNEVQREQISLEGLQEFGFTANIQGPEPIVGGDVLTPTVIRQQAVDQLISADIQYIADEEVRSSADIPFLHMHIHAMQLENGLVPFSIQLKLYQPVNLPLNRDLLTSASTWEISTVGLVSHDRIDAINREAESLMANFIDEYYRANPNAARIN